MMVLGALMSTGSRPCMVRTSRIVWKRKKRVQITVFELLETWLSHGWAMASAWTIRICFWSSWCLTRKCSANSKHSKILLSSNLLSLQTDRLTIFSWVIPAFSIVECNICVTTSGYFRKGSSKECRDDLGSRRIPCGPETNLGSTWSFNLCSTFDKYRYALRLP